MRPVRSVCAPASSSIVSGSGSRLKPARSPQNKQTSHSGISPPSTRHPPRSTLSTSTRWGTRSAAQQRQRRELGALRSPRAARRLTAALARTPPSAASHSSPARLPSCPCADAARTRPAAGHARGLAAAHRGAPAPAGQPPALPRLLTAARRAGAAHLALARRARPPAHGDAARQLCQVRVSASHAGCVHGVPRPAALRCRRAPHHSVSVVQVDGPARRGNRAAGAEDPGRAGRGAAPDAAAPLGGRHRPLRRLAPQGPAGLGWPCPARWLRRRPGPAEAGHVWSAAQGGGPPARRRSPVPDRSVGREGVGAGRGPQQRLAAPLAHRPRPVQLQLARPARGRAPPPQAAPAGALACTSAAGCPPCMCCAR